MFENILKIVDIQLLDKVKRFRLFGNEPYDGLPEGVCSQEKFQKTLEIERIRVDRNGHEFCLLMIDLEQDGLNKQKVERIIREIVDRVRDIDRIGWYDSSRIGIVLPYTSTKGARILAKDICREADTSGNQLEFSLYSYPLEKETGPEEIASANPKSS